MSDDERGNRERWARLRFAVVGPLLAAPPDRGELRVELERLATKIWRHPVTDEPVRFGVSTLERWLSAARHARRDPVGELRRRVRKDAGCQRSVSSRLRLALQAQYKAHPGWSYQLHVDNVAVLVAEDSTLGPLPSYSSIRRYLKAHGLIKQKGRRARNTPGAEQAARRLEQLEVRSYEAEYVHGLWHLDFHHGSRKILTPRGQWVRPILLGVLDDRSRLACHVQWYLEETAEVLVHGLSQAIQKRSLPRALMTDNGAAMLSVEVERGLVDLGILHETTLPYSPYQNAKQEIFWSSVEGRLMAMLEGVAELSLEQLNEATQAWVELEYNRARHSELGCSPLTRYLEGPEVGRPSPTSDELRRAFRAEATRAQRRSDGTIALEGQRFEVPSRLRHLGRVTVRYARWDLRTVDLVDPHNRTVLCALYPLDKARNADGRRRRLDPLPDAPNAADPAPQPPGIAPLLRKLLADYAATGLPPAYVPHETDTDPGKESMP
jgi:transposase InsO family protein